MNKSITLIELLLALVVTSIVILYFFAIEKIGRQDLFNTDHRAKVQNNVSYVLDHMTTNITGRKKLLADNITYQIRGGAIGNTRISPYPVDTTGIGGDNAIKIYIDSNNNGKLDPGSGTNEDKQIAYRYRPASASPATDRYQIWYYSNYTDYSGSYEVLTGNRIRPDFSSNTGQYTYVVYDAAKNYLDVQITGCWDPTQPDGSTNACGTLNNPSVTMHAYINMPSVSTN